MAVAKRIDVVDCQRQTTTTTYLAVSVCNWACSNRMGQYQLLLSFACVCVCLYHSNVIVLLILHRLFVVCLCTSEKGFLAISSYIPNVNRSNSFHSELVFSVHLVHAFCFLLFLVSFQSESINRRAERCMLRFNFEFTFW